MPYYCTVPRCTSMAGKAKNVSFHQFPRDEELARLWNDILKRGKPYTKYSKVCSLHFKPEDYTVTSVGKNKGQWRTLRKDAVPSQNLPSESPAPYTRRSPGCWVPSQPTVDPLVQQQMAQAIYMQTMLAMQAAGACDPPSSDQHLTPEQTQPSPSSSSLSDIDQLVRRHTEHNEVTYKCHECTKCFKDPDVFLLHKRTHKNINTNNTEKENYTNNIQREETLRANPILANLLKTRLEPENILTVENQIMTALASNMEAYIRTLTTMLASQGNTSEDKQDDDYEGDRDGNDLEAGNEACDGDDLCREDGNDEVGNEFECEHVDNQGNMSEDKNESDYEGDRDGNDTEANEAFEDSDGMREAINVEAANGFDEDINELCNEVNGGRNENAAAKDEDDEYMSDANEHTPMDDDESYDTSKGVISANTSEEQSDLSVDKNTKYSDEGLNKELTDEMDDREHICSQNVKHVEDDKIDDMNTTTDGENYTNMDGHVNFSDVKIDKPIQENHNHVSTGDINDDSNTIHKVHENHIFDEKDKTEIHDTSRDVMKDGNGKLVPDNSDRDSIVSKLALTC